MTQVLVTTLSKWLKSSIDLSIHFDDIFCDFFTFLTFLLQRKQVLRASLHGERHGCFILRTSLFYRGYERKHKIQYSTSTFISLLLPSYRSAHRHWWNVASSQLKTCAFRCRKQFLRCSSKSQAFTEFLNTLNLNDELYLLVLVLVFRTRHGSLWFQASAHCGRCRV